MVIGGFSAWLWALEGVFKGRGPPAPSFLAIELFPRVGIIFFMGPKKPNKNQGFLHFSRLGRSWGRLGPSWASLLAVLGRLGAFFGLLGPSWVDF